MRKVIRSWSIALVMFALTASERACAAPGDLFVSQPSDQVDDGSIISFNSLGQRSVFASGLGSFIGDIAFNTAGSLFEVDRHSDTITNTIFTIDPKGSRSAFVSAPYLLGIVFNKTGTLFAAKSDGNGGGSIVAYSPDGTPTTFAMGLTSPAELAFDGQGDLFLSEQFPADRILKFAPDGTQTVFASGLNDPTGMAFDNAGNLFVADQSSGKVLRFTPTGSESTFGSVVQPVDVAFDAVGNLFVSDFNNGFVKNGGFIYKFSPDGVRTSFASGIEPTFMAFQPVPEPYSIALTTVGMIGMIAFQPRRRHITA